jgi:ketosteroid isomerase-like protein
MGDHLRREWYNKGHDLVSIERSEYMKARLFAALLALVALATLHVQPAQAGIQPLVAAESFFTALDTGDHEAAVAMFTPDAVATLVRGERYQGAERLLQLVQLMEHPGRYHNIVQASMAGDTVTVVVEISDHGIRWGESKIVIEVQGGKLHSFREQALHVRHG